MVPRETNRGELRFRTLTQSPMKNVCLIAILLASGVAATAQSKTTLDLEKKFEGSFTLFFYKNTLRMLNQQENPEFDELIRNIEKMKFLLVDKNKSRFGPSEYKELTKDYQKESFEPIINGRMDGRNLDIYLRDAGGSKPGTVVLVNDSSSLYILDIVGTIDVSKAGALFKTIDGSTDIGSRIRNFTDQGNKQKKRKEKID